MPDALQGQPGTEPAPTAVETSSPSATPTPEAAPAAADAATATGTTTPTPPVPEPRSERVAVDDYEARLAAALAPAAESEPTPGEPAPDEPPMAEPEPAAEPVAEVEIPDGASPPPEPSVPDRIRLGGLSERDRALTSAAVLLAKAESISVAEAMARLSPPVAASAPEAPEPPPAAPREERAIRQEIDALKAQKKEAAAALDTARMVEIEERIDACRDEIDASRQAGADTARQREAAIADAHTRAVEMYDGVQAYLDDVKKMNAGETDRFSTPFGAKVDEITARLEETGNPLLNQPDALVRISQMAANELGIAPRAPGRPRASKSATATLKPQPVPQRAVAGRSTAAPAAAPASGSARTTPPGPPAPAFRKSDSPADYNRKLAAMGIEEL